MRIVVFEKRYLKGLYWISVVKYINPFSLISRLSENIIECYHVCLRISVRTKFRQKELHSKEALLQEDGALRLDLSRYILSSKCIFFIGVFFSNSKFYHNKSVLFYFICKIKMFFSKQASMINYIWIQWPDFRVIVEIGLFKIFDMTWNLLKCLKAFIKKDTTQHKWNTRLEALKDDIMDFARGIGLMSLPNR